MSPTSSGKGLHGPSVWRTLIILNSMALAVVAATISILFSINHDAIDATKVLYCRLGGFFVGQPIIQQPQQSEAQFQDTIHQVETFLHELKVNDCTSLVKGGVSREAINKELNQLPKVLRGGGHTSGTSPPTPPGEVHPAPQSSPRKPAPQPSPKPHPRPQPSPKPRPGLLDPLLDRVCSMTPRLCTAP